MLKNEKLYRLFYYRFEFGCEFGFSTKLSIKDVNHFRIMGTVPKIKKMTDKGYYVRRMQFPSTGQGPLKLTPTYSPLKLMSTLEELGLTGDKDLQSRYVCVYWY